MLSYVIWLFFSACEESDISDNKIMEGEEIGDCIDGIDNDSDGLFDCEDEGCWTNVDCIDDESPVKYVDNDEDGVPFEEDCDDTNPLSTIITEDGDCDGVLSADDCDDTNPSSTTIQMDMDCDGVLDSVDEDIDGDGTIEEEDCNDTCLLYTSPSPRD